jgi:uncharacterized membrane protein
VGFSSKTWGAIIGALVVFSIYLIGFGPTVVVVVAGVIGFFVGKFLDGELDLQQIQERAQGRRPSQ